MKSYLNKSSKYLFSVVSLALIFILSNSKFLSREFNTPHRGIHNADKQSSENELSKIASDLPCGYKMTGLEDPHKPTFLTSNDIPVLQYPAGNTPGSSFQISDAAYSDSQSDQIILQSDGNLVIYCLTCNPARPLWSTQTNGKGGKALFFQTDGNLVLRNANNKIIWQSNIKSTCAGSEQAYFTLQNDGNLAMLYDEQVGNKTVAAYLGGTASTNDQAATVHPARIF